jgi:hypothetical protein
MELILASAALAGDADSRAYQAFRHSLSAEQAMLLFVPHRGVWRRRVPFSDIRMIEESEDGRELMIETPTMLAVLQGHALAEGALMLASHTCGRIEAFHPTLHDRPGDPRTPLIKRIRFYDAPIRPAWIPAPVHSHGDITGVDVPVLAKE